MTDAVRSKNGPKSSSAMAHLRHRVAELERELAEFQQAEITDREQAELRLQGRSERYQQILSSLHSSGIIVYDRDGRMIEIWGSQDLDDRYGISASQAVGMSIEELLPPDQAKDRLKQIRQVFESGESVRSEHLVTLPHGDFWQDVVISPIRDSSGQITAVVSFIRDITDRMQAQLRLAGEGQIFGQIASGASLHEVLTSLTKFAESQFDGMLCSILLLDVAGRRLRHGASPSLPDDYVKAIDDVEIGPNVGSCGTAAYRDKQVIVSDIATDPLWRNYRDLALKHGLCACWSTPIHSSSRKILGTFAMYYREPRAPEEAHLRFMERLVDLASIVIEHTQNKRSLQMSEERISLAVKGSQDGHWYWDVAQRQGWWSPRLLEMLGYSEGEIDTSYAMFVRLIHPDDRNTVSMAIRNHLIEHDDYDADLRMRTKSGKYRSFHARGSGVWNEQGWPIRMAGSLRDITDRVRIELEAQQQREQLLHVTRLSTMGEMATGLAHELNQPLAAIANYVYAIEQKLKSPSAANPTTNIAALGEILEKIREQSVRAGSIIHHMRDFVRRKASHRSSCDVNLLLQEVADMVAADARHCDIQIELKLARSLPHVMIDAVQIQQVLLNLLRNAIDELASIEKHRRTVVVTTSTTLDATTGGRKSNHGEIEIAVRDSGRGFSEKNVERSFDAFFTTKPEGMGMGLAISRSIVEQHGGRMWAVPDRSVGAEVRFTLPSSSEAPSSEKGYTDV